MKDQGKCLFLSCAFCSFLVLSAIFVIVFGVSVAAPGIWAMNFKVQFANRSTIILMASKHGSKVSRLFGNLRLLLYQANLASLFCNA